MREGQYDDQDRLLLYGDQTFSYTKAGELLSRTEAGATTTYDYDVFGNLRRVDQPSGDTIEYLIDGRNRRIGRKVNGAVVQRFLYQDAVNPVAELDATGAVFSRFVYGTRAHVPDYMHKGGSTYRLISDHLGSVRLVVDMSSGEIAQRLDYDAFGRATLDTNPGFQPFGFAGGIYDPATGLVRFGARDYDAQVGRWTAKDPIGIHGGDFNLFAYVGNNPVNRDDPLGLARRCTRALEVDDRWLGGFLQRNVDMGPNSSQDRKNRRPVHEGFWFEDGTSQGFMGDGEVREDDGHTRDEYQCQGGQLDDQTLRDAIENVGEPAEYKALGNPFTGVGQSNCQDWVDSVMHEYQRLRFEKTRKTGKDPEVTFVFNKLIGRN